MSADTQHNHGVDLAPNDHADKGSALTPATPAADQKAKKAEPETDLGDSIRDFLAEAAPYLKKLGEAAEGPPLQRLKPEVALQVLAVKKEQIAMNKELAVERIHADERNQTRLLWFSAFALVVFGALLAVLVKFNGTFIAVGVLVGLSSFVSVLLGRQISRPKSASALPPLEPDEH